MMGLTAERSMTFSFKAFLVGFLVVAMLFGAVLSAEKADAAEKTGTVVIDALNVRTGAGTLNESLGLIYMGQKVTILGAEKD